MIKIVKKKLDNQAQFKRQQTSFENVNKSLDKYVKRNKLTKENAKGIENLKSIMNLQMNMKGQYLDKIAVMDIDRI